MLHTTQVDDVIPIAACCGLGGCYTGSHIHSWNIVRELCLKLGGTKMWSNGFHSLVLIILYGFVHFVGFLAMNLQSFLPTRHLLVKWYICSSRRQYRDYIIDLYVSQ